MKIFVHDFCGHAFTLSLATQLSARGHEVDYAYVASEPGPKGDFDAARARPHPPRIHALTTRGEYRKSAFVSRRRHDRYCGRATAALIAASKPDIVISTSPTEAQDFLVRVCQQSGIKFVYWMQDVYSIAATKLLRRKLGPLGVAIGRYYRYLDRKHVRASDRIVLITEDFRAQTVAWTGRNDNIDVIENWGALDEIPRRAHDNAWSRAMGVHDRFNFIYSGTLGLKHNPELLAALARELGPRGNVIVISQGASVPYLEARKTELGLDNLTMLPLQPFHILPDILGAADAFVATIEPDAGVFSVPSKVLSYLCAGRPIVLAVPLNNLAARIVDRAAAGRIVAPDDEAGFLEAAMAIFGDPNRAQLGENGRAYAEANFDLATVAQRFEGCFAAAQLDRRDKDQ
jgi:colanic acid biosynthesis glycosyl transferase WcaI